MDNFDKPKSSISGNDIHASDKSGGARFFIKNYIFKHLIILIILFKIKHYALFYFLLIILIEFHYRKNMVGHDSLLMHSC